MDIRYHSIVVEKKHLDDEMELVVKISKQLSAFLNENISTLMNYDRIIVYYDYGQRELAKILISVFNTVLNSVVIKKVAPANYKLFQAADMLCTLELLSLKAERKMLSNSELAFFQSARMLNKSYLRVLRKKRF